MKIGQTRMESLSGPNMMRGLTRSRLPCYILLVLLLATTLAADEDLAMDIDDAPALPAKRTHQYIIILQPDDKISQGGERKLRRKIEVDKKTPTTILHYDKGSNSLIYSLDSEELQLFAKYHFNRESIERSIKAKQTAYNKVSPKQQKALKAKALQKLNAKFGDLRYEIFQLKKLQNSLSVPLSENVKIQIVGHGHRVLKTIAGLKASEVANLVATLPYDKAALLTNLGKISITGCELADSNVNQDQPFLKEMLRTLRNAHRIETTITARTVLMGINNAGHKTYPVLVRNNLNYHFIQKVEASLHALDNFQMKYFVNVKALYEYTYYTGQRNAQSLSQAKVDAFVRNTIANVRPQDDIVFLHQEYYPRIERSGRGDVLLNRQRFDITQFGDETFAHMYVATFDQAETGHALTGKQNMWITDTGHVIIQPNELMTAQGGVEETLRVSFGEARGSLDLLRSAREASEPAIKSVLVKYEAIEKILDPRYLTTEPYSTRLNLDVNVDRHLPNQILLKSSSIELLRRNTLAGSLVTYVLNHNGNMEYSKHMGKVEPISDLLQQFDLPEKALPLDPGHFDGRKGFLENLGSDIESLHRNLQNNPTSQASNEMLSTFNSKYKTALNNDDMAILRHWSREAWARQDMSDQYYDHVESKYYLGDNEEILRSDMRDIFKDPIFEDVSGDQNLKMNKLIDESNIYASNLEKREKLFDFAEALRKNARLESERNPQLAEYLNRYSDAQNSRSRLSSGAMNILHTGLSLQEISDVSLGINLHTDTYRDFRERVLSSVRESLPSNVRDNWNLVISDRVYPAVGIGFSNADVSVLQNLGISDVLIIDMSDGSKAGPTYYDYVGGSKAGLSRIRTMEMSSQIMIAFSAESSMLANNRLLSLPNALDRFFTGHHVELLHFELSGITNVDTSTLGSFLKTGAQISSHLQFDMLSFSQGKHSLLLDNIANKMYAVGQNGEVTRLGTPVEFYNGHPVYSDRLLQISEVTIMKEQFGNDFIQAQKDKVTGVHFFDESDPISDTKYMRYETSEATTNDFISIKELTQRQTSFQNGDISQIKVEKVQTELIIQVGGDDAVKQVSGTVFDAKASDRSKKVFLIQFDDSGIFQGIKGDFDRLSIGFDTKVHIVGTGHVVDGSLKVAGAESGADLAEKLASRFASLDDNTKPLLGISDIQVQVISDTDVAPDKLTDFGQSFSNKVNDMKIGASSVEVQATQIEVLDNGKITVSANAPIHEFKLTPSDAELETDGRTLLDIEEFRKRKTLVADNEGLNVAMLELDSYLWGRKLKEATIEVLDKSPSIKEWVPVIESAVSDQDGFTQVNLFNPETQETVNVKMKSNAYQQYAKKSASYQKLTFRANRVSRYGFLLGFGTFIKSAIDFSKAEKVNAAECKANKTICEAAENLEWALNTHAIGGLAFGSFDIATGIPQLKDTNLGKNLNKGVKNVGKSLQKQITKGSKNAKKALNAVMKVGKHARRFLKPFFKVMGKAAPVVGFLGSGFSLAFSGIELHNAIAMNDTNAIIQAGLSVALDIVGVVVGVGTAVAAALTAAGGPIGAIVGVAVMVVSLIAQGVLNLVFTLQATASEAKFVGEYFYNVSEAYRSGGYDYDYESKTLSFQPFAVIDEIDLEHGNIQLGSQYIYRTTHGGSGSGKSNWFWKFWDFPQSVNWCKSCAINVRDGFGHQRQVSIRSIKSDVTTLILPTTPKCYIDYSWKGLPFCTLRHDKGFNIIRRLENDYRFDYDFYVFPTTEYIISNIEHEYVEQHVNVKLNSNVQQILVPNYGGDLQNKFRFSIRCAGPNHVIILNDGVSLSMINTRSSKCTWIFNINNVSNKNLIWQSNTMTFGNTRVHFPDRTAYRNQEVLIYEANAAYSRFDLQSGIKRSLSSLQSIRFNPRVQTTEQLKDELRALARYLREGMKFIRVTNFIHNGNYVGNAYYDADHDRFLFSDFEEATLSESFLSSIKLLAIVEERVFFMAMQKETDVVFWWAHAGNHNVGASYQFYCGSDGYQIKPISMQGEALTVAQIIQNVTLLYRLLPYELTLVAIEGREADVRSLAAWCFPTMLDFLPQPLRTGGVFPGECVYARTLPLLPLISVTVQNTPRHFWLYMNDTKPTKEYRDGAFCNPSESPVVTGIITPNFEDDECDDLMLIGIQDVPTGGKVYIFYCKKESLLYTQVNDNIAKQKIIPGGVENVDFESAIVWSKDGGLYSLEPSGEFSLFALSEHFLETSSDWTSSVEVMLNMSDSHNFIHMFGLKDLRSRDMSAWYDTIEEVFIIISPALSGGNITYLGPTNSAQLVWLYEKDNGNLILQTVMRQDEITANLQTNPPRWMSDSKPEYQIVHSHLKNVQLGAGGKVLGVTKDGVILSFTDFITEMLLGVTQTWVSERNEHLQEHLSELCQVYASSDVITLGHSALNNTHAVHNWFHCHERYIIPVILEKDSTPIYLGMNSKLNTAYFTAENRLIQVNISSGPSTDGIFQNRQARSIQHMSQDFENNALQKQTASIQLSNVVSKTLLIQAVDDGRLTDIPLLDGVSSLVVGSGSGNCLISLSEDVWLHYSTITVSSIGTDGAQSTALIVQAPYPCDYPWTVIGNNTVFADVINGNRLILEDYTPQAEISSLPRNPALLVFQICDAEPMFLLGNDDRPDARPSALKQPVNRERAWFMIAVYFLDGMASFIHDHYVAISAISSSLIILLISLYITHKCRRVGQLNKCVKSLPEDPDQHVQIDNVTESSC